MKIGKIDLNDKVMIVAELSSNHSSNLNTAIKTIKMAKKIGVDAVKLQTFTPEIMTLDSEKFMANPNGPWSGKKLYDLYKQSCTPLEWHSVLFKTARDLGLEIFSSPFSKEMVDFLESFNPCAYKIASFEITDIPLIEYTASKGKPIIISTGIASLADIEEAVGACRKVGNNHIVLLKCTSAYPTPIEEVNLRTIPNIASTFGCTVGLSDHSLGVSVPIAATALGARLIEKHFILSKDIESLDKEFSLTPNEFSEMIKSVRIVEKALGKVSYSLTEKMKKSKEFSRSLFVVQDIKKGEFLTEKNIRSIRPGYGLHPKYLKDVLGKRIRIDLKKGTPLKWTYIET